MTHGIQAKSYLEWDHISSPNRGQDSVSRYWSLQTSHLSSTQIYKQWHVHLWRNGPWCYHLLAFSALQHTADTLLQNGVGRNCMTPMSQLHNDHGLWNPLTVVDTTNKLGLNSRFVVSSTKLWADLFNFMSSRFHKTDMRRFPSHAEFTACDRRD